ncbi:MAG: hypothetical protein IJH52_00805 [Oscillospiraceae bacterium]|nr:hypothetical protein [Oscillospiraceae bacterium]MBQ6403774.1 hypothetical protein [Oscillospiraceae bacterium]
MQDLERLQKELQRQGKLDAVRRLAASPEASALQGRVSGADLNDPEAVKAALSRLLQTREGQALARKIQEAMEHG